MLGQPFHFIILKKNNVMKSNIPLELIDIEGEGYHLLLMININGKEARMVLDTGASRTVFDTNCIEEYISEPELKEEERLSTGVGSSSLKSYSILFEKLKIGEIEIENYPIAVLDLQHITTSYGNIGKGMVHGIVGGDLLHKFGAIIDYEKASLLLHNDPTA